MPDHLHAGPRRDVARRHRLRHAARGPDQVAHRRQGRLWRHAAGPEGASCRRSSPTASASRAARKKKQAAWLYIQCVTNKTNQLAHAQGRRRRAGALLGLCSITETDHRSRSSASSISTACSARPRSRAAGLPQIIPVTGVPRRLRRGADQHARRRRRRGRAEEGDRNLRAGPREERAGRERPAKR